MGARHSRWSRQLAFSGLPAPFLRHGLAWGRKEQTSFTGLISIAVAFRSGATVFFFTLASSLLPSRPRRPAAMPPGLH